MEVFICKWESETLIGSLNVTILKWPLSTYSIQSIPLTVWNNLMVACSKSDNRPILYFKSQFFDFIVFNLFVIFSWSICFSLTIAEYHDRYPEKTWFLLFASVVMVSKSVNWHTNWHTKKHTFIYSHTIREMVEPHVRHHNII